MEASVLMDVSTVLRPAVRSVGTVRECARTAHGPRSRRRVGRRAPKAHEAPSLLITHAAPRQRAHSHDSVVAFIYTKQEGHPSFASRSRFVQEDTVNPAQQGIR